MLEIAMHEQLYLCTEILYAICPLISTPDVPSVRFFSCPKDTHNIRPHPPSLSLLDAVNPSAEGSVIRVLLLQSSRSSTSTARTGRLSED